MLVDCLGVGCLSLSDSSSIAGQLVAQRQQRRTSWDLSHHSARSYVPTSGTDSKETGGYLRSRPEFPTGLEELGLRVLRSDNNHNPMMAAHTFGRGERCELLQGAVALFDVHRDAVPPEVYRTTINGEQMTKVRLVVGGRTQINRPTWNMRSG